MQNNLTNLKEDYAMISCVKFHQYPTVVFLEEVDQNKLPTNRRMDGCHAIA